MSTFDRTSIKNINISCNKGYWNPETHDMILTYDPKSICGFKINLVNRFDRPITDVTDATTVLKQFMLKK